MSSSKFFRVISVQIGARIGVVGIIMHHHRHRMNITHRRAGGASGCVVLVISKVRITPTCCLRQPVWKQNFPGNRAMGTVLPVPAAVSSSTGWMTCGCVPIMTSAPQSAIFCPSARWRRWAYDCLQHPSVHPQQRYPPVGVQVDLLLESHPPGSVVNNIGGRHRKAWEGVRRLRYRQISDAHALLSWMGMLP